MYQCHTATQSFYMNIDKYHPKWWYAQGPLDKPNAVNINLIIEGSQLCCH